MASNVFNYALGQLVNGGIDLNTDDIRAILVMTNTTADTEKDAITAIDQITTLDESDATGYSRQALGSETVTVDDTNDRAEFDATDISFSGMSGDASRAYQGVVIYKHVTNDTDSVPIAFIEFPATRPATATQVDVAFNSEGILQIAQA